MGTPDIKNSYSQCIYKANDSIEKQADLTVHIPKHGVQTADKHTERCSAVLVIRETQKTRRRRYYLPTRTASHSLKTSCVREPTEQAEPPYCRQDQKLTVQPQYPQQTFTEAMDKNGHSSASHKQPQSANNPNTHHQQDSSDNYGAFTRRNITGQRQRVDDNHTHPA